jgi:hypothetical protein
MSKHGANHHSQEAHPLHVADETHPNSHKKAEHSKVHETGHNDHASSQDKHHPSSHDGTHGHGEVAAH